MLCKEIMQVIEATYPTTAALDFDNVGLLAGRAGKEVNRVYLALDATDAVIDRALEAGADMLITHHPLIFSPLKKINDEDFISRRILKLIRNDISYYAMHTNYDVLGMAELSEKILGIRDTEVLDETMEDTEGNKEGIGRVGTLESPMTLEECCVYVKHKLNLGSIKVFGDMDKKVQRLHRGIQRPGRVLHRRGWTHCPLCPGALPAGWLVPGKGTGARPRIRPGGPGHSGGVYRRRRGPHLPLHQPSAECYLRMEI